MVWTDGPFSSSASSAETLRYLKTKIPLFCRYSTGLRTGCALGLPFNSLLRRRRLLRPLGSWSRWPRIFFPRRMGDDLVIGLIVTSVWLCVGLTLGCVLFEVEARIVFKTLYLLDVTS